MPIILQVEIIRTTGFGVTKLQLITNLEPGVAEKPDLVPVR